MKIVLTSKKENAAVILAPILGFDYSMEGRKYAEVYLKSHRPYVIVFDLVDKRLIDVEERMRNRPFMAGIIKGEIRRNMRKLLRKQGIKDDYYSLEVLTV